ncbi:MAG: hypothetical protein ACYC6G_02805 [Desulfobaccales bacterium]
MALQKSYEDKFGMTHEVAYFRIRRAIVDNFPTDAPPLFTAEVDVYANAGARQNEKAPLESILRQLADASDPAMQAGLAAAYDFLKSLPDFEGAQDV